MIFKIETISHQNMQLRLVITPRQYNNKNTKKKTMSNKHYYPLNPFQQSQKQLSQKQADQLLNKSHFFQGQLDPLIQQNHRIKNNLSEMQRLLQNSTDMLKNLLPIPSSPERKLALELANIEGVSMLIKQDWLNMKNQISQFRLELEEKRVRIVGLESRYQEMLELHRNQMQDVKTQYQMRIIDLNNKHTNTEINLQLKLEQLNKQYKDKKIELDIKQEQLKGIYQKHRREVWQLDQKIKQNNRTIQRIRQQQRQSLIEYEQSKTMLIQHYQALLIQQTSALKQQYELIIKQNEQQFNKNTKQLTIFIQQLQNRIGNKEQQILGLYQINNKYIHQKQQLSKYVLLLKQDILGYRKKIQIADLQIQKAHQQINKFQLKITEYAQKDIYFRNHIGQLNSSLQSLQQNFQQKQQANRQTVQNLRNQLKQIAQLHTDIKSQREKQDEFIAQLQRQIEKKKREIERYRKYEDENTVLLDSISELQKKCQSKQQQIDKKYEQLTNKQKQMDESNAKWSSILKQTESSINKKIQEALSKTIEQNKQKQKKYEQQQQTYITHIRQEQQRRQMEYRKIMQQKQKQYSSTLLQLKTHLSTAESLNNQLKESMTKAQLQHTSELENMKNMQTNLVAQLMQKHRKQVQQHEDARQRITNKLQKKLKDQQQEWQSLSKKNQQEYLEAIQKQQKEYGKQLNELQMNILELKSNKGLLQVQDKYARIMNKMKQQAQRQKKALRMQVQAELQQQQKQLKNKLQKAQNKHGEHMRKLKQQHKSEIKQLQSQQSRKLQQLQNQYNKQLQKLQNILQQNIATLNDHLIQQKQAHNFTKLTRQQKIQYLTNKIQQTTNKLEEREQQIENLKLNLVMKEQQLKKWQYIVEQRISEKKRECQEQMEKVRRQSELQIASNIQQCSTKIRRVEAQRQAFTTQLYLQFQRLKQNHDLQLTSINRKYNELERLFQQRPSREEDLNKIKSLLMQKQKMNMQAKQFQKKFIAANEIVKYLNMQFQNYKDVYDIFGPDQTSYQSKKQDVRNTPNSDFVYVGPNPNKDQIVSDNNEKLTKIKKLLKNRSEKLKTQGSIQKNADTTEPLKNLPSFYTMQRVDQQESQEQQQTLKQKYNNRKTALNFRKKKVPKSISNIQKIVHDNKNNEQSTINETTIKQDNDNYVQLRSNAQLLLMMISKEEKPAFQLKSRNTGYRRERRRTQSTISKLGAREGAADKKYKLKDKVIKLDI